MRLFIAAFSILAAGYISCKVRETKGEQLHHVDDPGSLWLDRLMWGARYCSNVLVFYIIVIIKFKID